MVNLSSENFGPLNTRPMWPKDFPEIACTDVYVAEMSKGTDCYYYTLIIECDDVEDINIEKERIITNKEVYSVRNNNFISTIMKLSSNSVYLQLGESKEITINEIALKGDNEVYHGIMLSVNPNILSSEDMKKIFFEFGIEGYTEEEIPDNIRPFNKSHAENEYYLGVINVEDDNYILETYVTAINKLSRIKGIDEVQLHYDDIVGGVNITENWAVTDKTIAEIVESGGEPVSDYNDTVINKTITVSGVKPGCTNLYVTREQGCRKVTKTCEIGIYIPGDVNLDSEINTEDALDILKQVVRLKELPEVSRVAGDLNEDNEITATDALDILRMVVGLE